MRGATPTIDVGNLLCDQAAVTSFFMQGDIGPYGPAGPTGSQGQTGATGGQGAKGATGAKVSIIMLAIAV